MTNFVPFRVEIAIGRKRDWTRSGDNDRSHHFEKARRVRAQRKLVAKVLCAIPRPKLPIVVKLTRLSAGTMDLGDGLSSALKAFRDEVAKWCGCGDSPSDPITWVYAQEKCPSGRQFVRIEWEEA